MLPNLKFPLKRVEADIFFVLVLVQGTRLLTTGHSWVLIHPTPTAIGTVSWTLPKTTHTRDKVLRYTSEQQYSEDKLWVRIFFVYYQRTRRKAVPQSWNNPSTTIYYYMNIHRPSEIQQQTMLGTVQPWRNRESLPQTAYSLQKLNKGYGIKIIQQHREIISAMAEHYVPSIFFYGEGKNKWD